MPIPATEPTVLSATYDNWAFRIETHGFGCARFGGTIVPPVAATIAFRKFRIRDDEIPELSPLDSASDHRVFDVPDLYALAADEPAISDALAGLVAAIGEYATRAGWI